MKSEKRDVTALPHRHGYSCEQAEVEIDRLARERDRARHLAKHLFEMVTLEQWRDTGGDDGQGHYEGDYRAAELEEEILSWAK